MEVERLRERLREREPGYHNILCPQVLWYLLHPDKIHVRTYFCCCFM